MTTSCLWSADYVQCICRIIVSWRSPYLIIFLCVQRLEYAEAAGAAFLSDPDESKFLREFENNIKGLGELIANMLHDADSKDDEALNFVKSETEHACQDALKSSTLKHFGNLDKGANCFIIFTMLQDLVKLVRLFVSWSSCACLFSLSYRSAYILAVYKRVPRRNKLEHWASSYAHGQGQ